MRGVSVSKIFLLLILYLTSTGAQSNSSLTIERLEQLLKLNKSHVLEYQETRESPWLQAPIVSEGTMALHPPMIEKKARLPRSQTWRLQIDHMEMINSEGSQRIYFSQSPQVGTLANAIRGVVTGELSALLVDFNIDVKGDETSWSVKLKPRTEDASKYLSQIEFDGTDSFVSKIVVVEPQGEKTTTILFRPLKP